MELLSYLKHTNHFSEEECITLDAAFDRAIIPKGTVIQKVNRYSKRLLFIESGLLRVFYVDDGKDITHFFFDENYFIAPVNSIFASSWFPMLMKWTGFPRVAYAASMYRVEDIAPEVLRRLDHEVKFKGIAEASPQQFHTTSLEQELEDRHNFLFAKMTMPVLFLQGNKDPGQHPEEYENTPDFVAHGRVEFIDGNHFFQLGAPEATSKAMRDFLSEPLS